MSKPFRGVINLDIRDSVPDWAPFEPPRAPDGAPNVVYIVLDDVGFSAVGFHGAETNQWHPDLVYDNHPVDQPSQPEDGYHLTVDLTDKALEFIMDAKAVAPDKPFCLYYAPGACHAPHHVSKEWIEKYKGRFDMGYEAMREQTLERQKKLGIVPADTRLPALNPIGTPQDRKGPNGEPFPAVDFTRPWASLSD